VKQSKIRHHEGSEAGVQFLGIVVSAVVACHVARPADKQDVPIFSKPAVKVCDDMVINHLFVLVGSVAPDTKHAFFIKRDDLRFHGFSLVGFNFKYSAHLFIVCVWPSVCLSDVLIPTNADAPVCWSLLFPFAIILRKSAHLPTCLFGTIDSSAFSACI
jgi:hypothetical protein